MRGAVQPIEVAAADEAAPRRDLSLPPLVLLHGWGSDSRVMKSLAAALPGHVPVSNLDLPGYGDLCDQAFPAEIEQLARQVLARCPPHCVLVGWSLGGAIATWIASRAPDRVRGLVTIATSPCFVRRADSSRGMPAPRFARFRSATAADATAQLNEFTLLQARGSAKQRDVVRQLRAIDSGASVGNLLSSLDMLRRLDNCDALRSLRLPSLHVLGANDAVMEYSCADWYGELQPAASTWVVEDAGHAPFLSHGAALGARITDFLTTHFAAERAQLPSKAAVAHCFGLAAPGYSQSARLQQSAGTQLLEGVSCQDTGTVLDLGCGPGNFHRALCERIRPHRSLLLDISERMLGIARLDTASTPAFALCADAEQLPLADCSVDTVWSNLAIQWCPEPTRVFSEIARVLRNGGEAHLATLGPDTLWELRAAWRQIDNERHVNRLAPIEELVQAVHDAGLELLSLRQSACTPGYGSVWELARELKRTGANGVGGRERGVPASRETWRRLERAYAAIGGDGKGLHATYQIVLLHLAKPGA